MRRYGRFGVLVGLFALTLPALAFAPKQERTKQALEREPAQISGRSERIDPAEPTLSGASAREFLARHGGDWVFLVDRRTGKPDMIQGSGIPLVPGRGNALDRSKADDLFRSDGEIDVLALEPAVRKILRAHDEWLEPATGELVLDTSSSLSRERGRLVTFNFAWRVGGVPVENAGVFVRLNSGNVVQLGSSLVGPIALDTRPAVSAAAAQALVLEYGGDGALARPLGAPALLIQPADGAGKIDYRLVWRVTYGAGEGMETWEGRVDAHTGEVVSFRDINQYAHSVGGVYPRTIYAQNEGRVPLPFLSVTAGGGGVTSNAAGVFAYTGGGTSSGLNGLYFNTNCSGCTAPAQPSVTTSIGTGRIDFGVGGQDQIGNGRSSPADRNAFYHLNQVRRIALKWLPTLPWLATTNFAVNVNINQNCNATYSGTAVNFYRSGSGCNNTGEIADVMYHEWGHGIDSNTNPGNGSTGEGTADVVSIHMTHGSEIGPGFRTTGAPVRDVNSATSPGGVVTLSNATSVCGGGVHCVGQTFGQSAWDLAHLLIARYGHHTGWRESERLFFTSLPDADTHVPFSPQSIYSAYLLADDDDGNLANGTPNAQQIFTAFNAHGIAENLLPATPPCSRPPQPILEVASQCSRFELSWNAVAGAAGYEVFRSELRENMAYFSVATLPAGTTSYADTEVAPGVDYWYVLMAVNGAGCESTVESPNFARLTAQPVLDLTAATADDTPRGNRSGFPDPGEEVDLTLTLVSLGEIGATTLSGTLTSTTPGVTIVDGTATWATLAPGGAGVNQDALRFQADASVPCGSLVQFRLVPAEATGCAVEPAYFSIRLGQPDGSGGFVCDPTPACFVEPTFSGLAAASSGSSCAEADLSWGAAASHCSNATLSYRVYRGTDPAFEPGPSNRIAAGLSGTAFTDTLLPPGQTFHYVVRAFDSRSGEESNLVRGSVVSPGAPDIRPPQFSGLGSLVTGAGCGEVLLGWTAAGEICSAPVSYQIYRSTDPLFVPGPSTLVGSSLSQTFVDAALASGQSHTYVVRARDAAGNEDPNGVRMTAAAGATDLTLDATNFEGNNGGWSVVAPNTATSGNWEWADPQATTYQPEDDATPPPGTHCWVTGPLAGTSAGAFDVDGGVTTLLSKNYDLSGASSAVVRYQRWFTNDRGASPGEDPLVVEVTNNGGTSWTLLEQVGAGTPLAWVPVALPLPIAPTNQVRVRFTAQDLGAGSLVEALVDDFEIIAPGGGCSICPPSPGAVGTILVRKSGPDVIIDWSADPVVGARFVVYKLGGAGFTEALRIGTTDQRVFVHSGAALASENFNYRVSAVDACGNESPL